MVKNNTPIQAKQYIDSKYFKDALTVLSKKKPLDF